MFFDLVFPGKSISVCAPQGLHPSKPTGEQLRPSDFVLRELCGDRDGCWPAAGLRSLRVGGCEPRGGTGWRGTGTAFSRGSDVRDRPHHGTNDSKPGTLNDTGARPRSFPGRIPSLDSGPPDARALSSVPHGARLAGPAPPAYRPPPRSWACWRNSVPCGRGAPTEGFFKPSNRDRISVWDLRNTWTLCAVWLLIRSGPPRVISSQLSGDLQDICLFHILCVESRSQVMVRSRGGV